MNLKKEIIYNYLSECNRRVGGYTGKDIDKISKILRLNRRTVKRNVENWSKTDPGFAELKYVGQHLTLDFHQLASTSFARRTCVLCELWGVYF